MRIGRSWLRLALAVLWLVDAGLQMKPVMFTASFSSDVIGAAATGQARFVAAPAQWAATTIAHHPFPWNVLFAGLQALIGLGLLSRRSARVALVASTAWALMIWYLGEGLGGLTGPGTWLFTGAPGAALIYAVLSVAAWPEIDRWASPSPSRFQSSRFESSRFESLPSWLLLTWAAYWLGGAVLHIVNGPTRAPDLAADIAAAANDSPGWLARVDFSLARGADRFDRVDVWLLVALQAVVGLLVFLPRARIAAVTAGLAISVVIWIVGQDFGQVATSEATDVGTAPLIVLLGLATLATGKPRYARGSIDRVGGRRIARAVRFRP